MADKLHLGDWTKQAVAIGGSGDLTLGASPGYPTLAETVGVNNMVVYTVLNANLSPLEIGYGRLINANTFTRETVRKTFSEGTYSSGASLPPANIPAGSVFYTAPTEDMLELLMLEMALIDIGNTTGAVTVSLRHKAIKLNLTANATLTFEDLPPAGVKYELTLHATSNNAGSADYPRGFLLTLPASCLKGPNPCPAIPLAFGAEAIIKLSSVDAGLTFKVEVLDFKSLLRDLGNVSGTISLDARYPATKMTMAIGSSSTLNISGVSPDIKFDEPAHFTIFNNTDGTRTALFDPEKFDFVNSTLNSISIPLGFKADFTVRRNPNTIDSNFTYDVYANGISYNITASGLATTWNPSDGAIGATEPLPFSLSAGNSVIERTGPASASPLVGKSARAFGGKNSGKWRVSVLLETAWGVTDSNRGNLAFGVATAAAPLTTWFSDTTTGFALLLNTPNGTGTTMVASKENNGVLTTLVAAGAANVPVIGVVLSALVDLDANKIWFLRNGAALGGGNPEAGTGQDFSLIDGAIFFPAIAMSETNVANTGSWRLLNEVSDPYGEIFPSFNYWTA